MSHFFLINVFEYFDSLPFDHLAFQQTAVFASLDHNGFLTGPDRSGFSPGPRKDDQVPNIETSSFPTTLVVPSIPRPFLAIFAAVMGKAASATLGKIDD